MAKVIIMRGPAGSGKSTLASKLNDGSAVVCSADHFYFFGKEMIPENYNFVPSLIGNAHDSCRQKFKDAIKSNKELVIVDNTNIKAKEFNWYAKYAIDAGYDVEFHSITGCEAKKCTASTVHKVPEHVVSRMIENFAETPKEINGKTVKEFKYDFSELRKNVQAS